MWFSNDKTKKTCEKSILPVSFCLKMLFEFKMMIVILLKYKVLAKSFKMRPIPALHCEPKFAEKKKCLIFHFEDQPDAQ